MFLPAFNIHSLTKSHRNFFDEFKSEWYYSSFFHWLSDSTSNTNPKQSFYVPVISAGGLEDSLLLVLLLGDLPTTAEGFESKVRGQKELNTKLEYEKKNIPFIGTSAKV